MKINQITNRDNRSYRTNYHQKTFKGIVNGKYFSEEVIAEAKKALNNPHWRDKFLARKRTINESLSTWHEREGSNDLTGRILMGIFTLGISEITWGLAQTAMDASDNKSIDDFIKQVEECMKNL